VEHAARARRRKAQGATVGHTLSLVGEALHVGTCIGRPTSKTGGRAERV